MKLTYVIESHPAVEKLEFETDNGWWAYLRSGWIDGESLCHAIREDTLTEVKNRLGFVRRKREGDPK